MSTDGLNFRLGRMRLNVDRKREAVKKHQDELAQMEDAFRLTCPHVEFDQKPVLVPSADFYCHVEPRIELTCKMCGLVRLK